MNTSRLERVWINLQFVNPATEGGDDLHSPHVPSGLQHTSAAPGCPSLSLLRTGTSSKASPPPQLHPSNVVLRMQRYSYLAYVKHN